MRKAKVAGCILVGSVILAGCETIHKVADTLETSAGILDGAADDLGAIWDNSGGVILPSEEPVVAEPKAPEFNGDGSVKKEGP